MLADSVEGACSTAWVIPGVLGSRTPFSTPAALLFKGCPEVLEGPPGGQRRFWRRHVHWQEAPDHSHLPGSSHEKNTRRLQTTSEQHSWAAVDTQGRTLLHSHTAAAPCTGHRVGAWERGMGGWCGQSWPFCPLAPMIWGCGGGNQYWGHLTSRLPYSSDWPCALILAGVGSLAWATRVTSPNPVPPSALIPPALGAPQAAPANDQKNPSGTRAKGRCPARAGGWTMWARPAGLGSHAGPPDLLPLCWTRGPTNRGKLPGPPETDGFSRARRRLSGIPRVRGELWCTRVHPKKKQRDCSDSTMERCWPCTQPTWVLSPAPQQCQKYHRCEPKIKENSGGEFGEDRGAARPVC